MVESSMTVVQALLKDDLVGEQPPIVRMDGLRVSVYQAITLATIFLA